MSAFSLPYSPAIFTDHLHRFMERFATTLEYKILTSTISAVYLAPLHFPRKTTYLDQ